MAIQSASDRVSHVRAEGAVQAANGSGICGGVGVEAAERRAHFLPEPFRVRGGQSPAVQDDWRVTLFLGEVEERQLQLLLVGIPDRMVRSNQFRAAFHGPAGYEIAEAEDAAADAVARFEDGDLRARPRQFVRGGEPREPGADDDHSWGGWALGTGEPIAEQHAGRGRQRPADHLAPIDRFAKAGVEAGVEGSHGPRVYAERPIDTPPASAWWRSLRRRGRGCRGRLPGARDP